MESNLELFKTADGNVTIPVRMEAGSMWLTRMQMAELFGVTPQNITLHMKKVYASGELDEKSTSKESLLVHLEGNRQICRKVLDYNLDAIISVGYRVNSARATQFRIWGSSRRWARFTSHLAGKTSIRLRRRRRRTCCIS